MKYICNIYIYIHIYIYIYIYIYIFNYYCICSQRELAMHCFVKVIVKSTENKLLIIIIM